MAMIELPEFQRLVARIAALGINEDLAGDYAAIVGDIHQFDADGNVLVIDEHGRHLATLPASVLASADPQPDDG
jgi:hypothetical protein